MSEASDVGDAHLGTSAVDLQFFNGSPDTIEVLDVFSNDRNLAIEFFPTIVRPYSYLYIAQVAFRGILDYHIVRSNYVVASTEGKFKGRIQLRTNSTIPVNEPSYKAHVMFGQLQSAEESSIFSAGIFPHACDTK